MQANLLLLMTLLTCSLTLVLSVYPGILNDWMTLLPISLLWLGGLGWLAIALLRFWIRRHESGSRREWQNFVVIGLLLVVSYGLLKFYVPRRMAFSISRPAFEQWLAQNPDRFTEGVELNTKLGLYAVEFVFSGDWQDSYFRTYHHGDGLGPDTVSYGFAFQPNPHQSPLGQANYGVYPLGDRWYWFRASNDW